MSLIFILAGLALLFTAFTEWNPLPLLVLAGVAFVVWMVGNAFGEG